MYAVLIGLHAAAGVVAFGVGLLTLLRGRYLRVYQVSLAAMLVFLVLAIGSTAADREGAGWLIPGALVVLGGVMVLRSVQAGGVHPTRVGGRTPAYVGRVGFGLVGLFDAFWVVALLRMELPGIAVAAVGVGIAVVGHLLLGRLARQPSVATGPSSVGPSSVGPSSVGQRP